MMVAISCAVATKGLGLINGGFGDTKIQVYELSTSGQIRRPPARRPLLPGGYGNEESLETVIRAINDCHAVFVAKVGGCPKNDLLAAGIEPVDQFAHEFIEKFAIAFKTYLVNAGEIEHHERGDAEIRPGVLIAAQ